MQPTYTINNKMSYILGISAYYHDAAAALIKDGEIIAAAQEERFTRIKNDASFPANASVIVYSKREFYCVISPQLSITKNPI